MTYVYYSKIIRWIKKHYHNPEVLITENGWPDDEDYDDKSRLTFMAEHLAQVIKSIYVYGCNIKGYAIWSLMDNFEWLNGYRYLISFLIHRKTDIYFRKLLFYIVLNLVYLMSTWIVQRKIE